VIDLDPERRPTISIDESAIVLGISRASAYEAAKNGELPTVRFGRRIRVPSAALRRLLALDEPTSRP
jgi:excisionase family DNA binding protein